MVSCAFYTISKLKIFLAAFRNIIIVIFVLRHCWPSRKKSFSHRATRCHTVSKYRHCPLKMNIVQLTCNVIIWRLKWINSMWEIGVRSYIWNCKRILQHCGVLYRDSNIETPNFDCSNHTALIELEAHECTRLIPALGAFYCDITLPSF